MTIWLISDTHTMSQSSPTVKARYRERHRDKLRAKSLAYSRANAIRLKDRHLRRRYGITIEDYDRMHAEKRGLCAICNRPERGRNRHNGQFLPLAVDHDHLTKKVRALLCYQCNAMLGFVENNPTLIENMQAYLGIHDALAL